MIKTKRSAILLLCVMMLGVFTGCASNTAAGNANKEPDVLLQEATAWFEDQTSYYEIISGEVVGDSVVLLTGTKNPGTDAYQLLQAFIVEQTEDTFAVSAWKDGERGISAGFSAHVLATDDLTVVFGDTADSIFDFINDRRIDVAFTEARILLPGDKSETKSITGNAPYLLVLDGMQAVEDIEFVSGEQTVVYSDFYSDSLMENSATLDTTHLFEQR